MASAAVPAKMVFAVVSGSLRLRRIGDKPWWPDWFLPNTEWSTSYQMRKTRDERITGIEMTLLDLIEQPGRAWPRSRVTGSAADVSR